MAVQQFCLRWNNHQPNFISVFSSLLNNESLVDVTLAAEGRHLQAHKVVLSACSSYFQSLFMVNPCQHPIVILKDVKFMDLKIMVDFMYYGEVNVSQEQLPHVLKTAEMLKIKGLAEMPDSTSLTKSQSSSTEKAELLTPGESNWSSDGPRLSSSPSPCPLSPGSRRKRLRKSSSGSGSASTERTSEEHQGELALTSPTNIVQGVVTKVEPNSSFSSDTSAVSHVSTLKQLSNESDVIRSSSQDNMDDERQQHSSQIAHTRTHVSLQMAQPELQSVVQQQQTIDNPMLELSDPSTSGACVQQTVHQVSDKSNGAKRGRQLMRQSRVKKDSDSSQQSPDADLSSQHYMSLSSIVTPKIERCEPPQQQQQQQMSSIQSTQSHSAALGSSDRSSLTSVTHSSVSTQHQQQTQYLNVPSSVKIERQCSEPSQHLLTVPRSSTLVKQHSHPLLPSQIQQQTSSSSNTPSVGYHSSITVSMGTTSGGSTIISPFHDTERPMSPLVIQDSLKLETLTSGTSSSATSLPTLRVRTDELRRAVSSPQQSGSPRITSHCPVVRPGPALGCNFCWNTIDGHGRILRRKTKYHCPECQTNLCIVPCFQEFHERHSANGPDPTQLTSAIQRVFPKTSSI